VSAAATWEAAGIQDARSVGILEVAEVDRDDPALVVALCGVDTPADFLPPRDRLGRKVLALVDRAAVVNGARGALPASAAQYHRATSG
jgi:hypothetical protein